MNSAGKTWCPRRGAIKSRHQAQLDSTAVSPAKARNQGWVKKATLQTQKGHLLESNRHCNSEQH